MANEEVLINTGDPVANSSIGPIGTEDDFEEVSFLFCETGSRYLSLFFMLQGYMLLNMLGV